MPLNTGMSVFHDLRVRAAQAQAARAFPAPHRVVFPLTPSTPANEEKIDEISRWARSPDRAGRSRRTYRDDDGELIFEFEKAIDAVECSLRFL
jgi:hypothetical protein